MSGPVIVVDKKVKRTRRFCSHCGRGNAPRYLITNSSFAAVREVDVLRLILHTIGNSAMSLGKLGSTMVSTTGKFWLPQYFKSRHCGIKKLLEAHQALFCLDNSHQFNPHVRRTHDSAIQIQRMLTMARVNPRDTSLFVKCNAGLHLHSPLQSIDDLASWRPKVTKRHHLDTLKPRKPTNLVQSLETLQQRGPMQRRFVYSPRPRYELWQTQMFMRNIITQPEAYQI